MAYTLTGRRGGTVRFVPMQNGVVEKESESYSSSITSNPVEGGADINDHVNNAAGKLSISGTIIGGEEAIIALKAMRDSRDVIAYAGKVRMGNLVFTSLKFDYSYTNKNGAAFSATLTKILMTSPEYVPMNTKKSMTSQDSGKNKKKQLKKTKKAGLKMKSSQTVSSASKEKYKAVSIKRCSLAPLTRQTGGYSGIM